MPPKKSAKTLTFEQGLEQLESIASQMEKGEAPLEDLLKLYEEGIKLSETLSKRLDEMEGKMLLVREGENHQTETVLTDLADADKQEQ